MDNSRDWDDDDDAYHRVCGNTEPVNVTEGDVDELARRWAIQGEPCDPEMVEAAKRVIRRAVNG